MKYNEKYDRWVDDDLIIYRWDKRLDKLVQVKLQESKKGYVSISCVIKHNIHTHVYLHRFLWETYFGEIPEGFEIDHINTIKTDNRLENLRCVTHKENINNPLTRGLFSEVKIGKPSSRKGVSLSSKTKRKLSESKLSVFGKKFKEHYGITHMDNHKLYHKELEWYRRHNKTCRWEIGNE